MTQGAAHHIRVVVPDVPWTRALVDGTVQIPGVTLECHANSEHAPVRFGAAEQAQFEVGEQGIRPLLLELLEGRPARALPVFFGREHMQRNLIVRTDSRLAHPRDLVGKRIGSRQPIVSGTNVGIVLMLEQGYGVAPDQLDWVTREPSGGLAVNRMGITFQQGPSSNAAVFELLRRGELDAATVTGGPRYWSLFGPDGVDRELAGYPELRPLITDQELIAETYRRTGIYPITDFVVLRPGLAEQQPALPRQLMAAFTEANRHAATYRSLDEEVLAQREIALLGEDPHQYGLGPKARRSIGALIDLLYRLGAIEQAPKPDALFAVR
jgi:4,5-dihydroxyphthalate decarboxylase